MSIITIERKILEKNDSVAELNRAFLEGLGIFSFNLVSSPGSGKTSILERTLEHLDGTVRIAVIEGDVQTDIDAQRLAKYNIPAVQIVTRGGCHLDAPLVRDALQQFESDGLQLLIIENVGNLVCPANYDLGESAKVVVVSTTEGDDKPLKYPQMFRQASVLIINKIDLLPYVNCSIDALRKNALSINPHLTVFETSCTTKAGIDRWCNWITSNISKQ
ncbi:MAG TPA: hydrogenase nickel incorporation protein HypB [Bacteroidota bacterium]